MLRYPSFQCTARATSKHARLGTCLRRSYRRPTPSSRQGTCWRPAHLLHCGRQLLGKRLQQLLAPLRARRQHPRQRRLQQGCVERHRAGQVSGLKLHQLADWGEAGGGRCRPVCASLQQQPAVGASGSGSGAGGRQAGRVCCCCCGQGAQEISGLALICTGEEANCGWLWMRPSAPQAYTAGPRPPAGAWRVARCRPPRGLPTAERSVYSQHAPPHLPGCRPAAGRQWWRSAGHAGRAGPCPPASQPARRQPWR